MDVNTHLHKTWLSLIRKQRRRVAAPLVPFEFLTFDGDIVQYDKQKFYDFCDEAGATVSHELEMVGEPVKLDGLEFTKRWHKGNGGYLLQLGINANDATGFLYFPLSQLTWTCHRNLLRRKTKPHLTSYGHERLSTLKRSYIHAWGEQKSALSWSKDARAMVSDKTITARINNGWIAEAAIATPKSTQTRPG
jgi:hypothetical protein